MALRERHDVREVGAAPRVDALRIVSNRHDLMMTRQLVDDVGLQAVRVLKLVDQDVLEAVLILLADLWLFA